MNKFHVDLLSVVLLTLLSFTPRASAQAMQLEWQGESGGVRKLRVTNATAPNINLQGSHDFQSWFVLSSATPDQGVASFEHSDPAASSVWFYRAVAEPAPAPINVGPELDETLSDAVILSPEEGGQLSITDDRGIRYQLTLPPKAVSESTLIKMTVITNFTNMPLEDRFRAAVMFEPDGLELRALAELKIHYPDTLPSEEMLGYAFDGAGSELSLHPWEAATNDVTMTIRHFSGAGVNAQSFQAATPPTPFNNASSAYIDALRNAEREAGEAERQDSQRLKNGEIGRDEFNKRQRLHKEAIDIAVYERAIKPFLEAAKSDCKLGNVLLDRLNFLVFASKVSSSSGEYFDKLMELTPFVRCKCAHDYIDECTKNPTSNVGVTLVKLLAETRSLTGVGAQGCDLGSDEDVLARFYDAPCSQYWEGSIYYQEIRQDDLHLAPVTQPVDVVFHTRKELVYAGHITGEKAHEFVPAIDDQPETESWKFSLSGKMLGIYLNKETDVETNPKWTKTYTDTERGSGGLIADHQEDEFQLYFLNGALKGMSLGIGLDLTRYEIPITSVRKEVVDCRASDPRVCPKPRKFEPTVLAPEEFYAGNSWSPGDPGVTYSYSNGTLTLKYEQQRKETADDGSITTRIERARIVLMRSR